MTKKIKVGDSFTNKKGHTGVVVKYVDCNNIHLKFKDGKNYTGIFSAQILRKGFFKSPLIPSVVSVGYLGIGEHKPSRFGKPTEEYRTWGSMLKRSCCPKFKSEYVSYTDCTVCEEWLDFQVFADWYVKQKGYGLGFHLDKDILSKGIKIYSPETCCLVPQKINCLLLKSKLSVNNYKQGVYKKPIKFGKYSSSISINNSKTNLGVFKTEDEAHTAYVAAKKAHVKEVANFWKDKIDSVVYDKLMNWEFKENYV